MKITSHIIIILSLVLSCKPIEPRQPIQQNSGRFIDESVERNKNLNAREYARIKALVDSSEINFTRSDYGFWYAYNKKNTSSDYTPKFGDAVAYSFAVKTLDGKWIYAPDTTKKQTYYVYQENLFSGLREGLKLMKKNESITFIFPSQLAFGYYGDNDQIGANTPLIYEVTVHDITTNP